MVEEWVIKAQRVKELIPSEELPHIVELAKKRLMAQQRFVAKREVAQERINMHETVFNLMLNWSTLVEAGKAVSKSKERTRQLEAKFCRTIMKCYTIYKRSQKHGRL